MSRQFKITLVVLFVGVAVLGTIFAQKKPANIPLAVTIYDTYTVGTITQNSMLRSDLDGEYINGVDSVTAYIDGQYGEFNFEVKKTSPRRILLEFNERTKQPCEGCKDRNGKTMFPPGVGQVNYLFFSTFNRSPWTCEILFGIDCTQDFLHMIPETDHYTNSRIGFSTPSYYMYFLQYIRACENPTQIGYIFVHAGQDLDGCGFADEWDLYPIPPEFMPPALPSDLGERALVTLIQGGGKICNFGRYELPFKIHLRKL